MIGVWSPHGFFPSVGLSLALRMTYLTVLLVFLTACGKVTYRKFEYAAPEAPVESWLVRARLAGTWEQANGTKEPTFDFGSPYELWLVLEGVSPSATVIFEDMVLISAVDGTATSMVFEPARWSEPPGYMVSSAPALELAYHDYVLSGRVTVEDDSGVVERAIRLALDRSYTEESRSLLSEFIWSM